jgi:hypothetical protein
MTLNEYKFELPPQSNMKLSFGEDSNFYIHFHAKKKPNGFHRWMLRKLLSIKLEDL